MSDENAADGKASEAALAFGSLIRSRRKALKMRQGQLALATGVGRRFLIVSFLGSKPSSSDEERLEPFFSHRLTP